MNEFVWVRNELLTIYVSVLIHELFIIIYRFTLALTKR